MRASKSGKSSSSSSSSSLPPLELGKVVVVVATPPSLCYEGLEEGSCATRTSKKVPVLRGP